MIRLGSAAYRRTNLALFAAGLATFGLMYSVQPLLPVLAAAFGRGAAGASLVLSATTLVLAVALLMASGVADRFGRKPVMVASLLASAALCLACAAAPGFWALVGLRAAMGVTLSGVPAVAMAYVAEEMAPEAAGPAIGLFIGGSAIGGMSGRLFAAALSAGHGWRVALAVTAALGLACAVTLARFLPPSRHWQRREVDARALGLAFRGVLRRAAERRLIATAFLLMGGFVAIYNYVGFRLLAPPYALSPAHMGLIFSVYLLGAASSSAAGRLVLPLGRRRVLGIGLGLMAGGVALTLAAPLPVLVAGVAVMTVGFFAAHSAASGWVAAEGGAARAQASALYLFFYYAGSSAIGSVGGLAWSEAGWGGLVALVEALVAVAVVIRP